MAEFSLKPILTLFIVVLIGIVFLGEIADNQIENTELSSTGNETITMSATTSSTVNESITITSQTGNVAGGAVIAVSFFGNGTNSTHLANVAIGIEVNITRSGRVTVDAEEFPADGIYNISYTTQNVATGSTANEDVISVSFFGLGSDNISTSINGISVGAEINFTKAGAITASPYNFSAGLHNISYVYEGALYVTDTKSHIFLKLLTIFFVFVVVAFAIKTMSDSSDNFNFGFKKE